MQAFKDSIMVLASDNHGKFTSKLLLSVKDYLGKCFASGVKIWGMLVAFILGIRFYRVGVRWNGRALEAKVLLHMSATRKTVSRLLLREAE
ncbi:hypothetical protein Tco_0713445 [Tanacetum coccineum]